MSPQASTSSGNYLIVAELRSGSLTKFERAVEAFGTAVRLNQTVWLLRSDATMGSIKNHLMTCTGRNDMLFIVDVGAGRRAWSNVGFAIEAQVRSIWSASP